MWRQYRLDGSGRAAQGEKANRPIVKSHTRGRKEQQERERKEQKERKEKERRKGNKRRATEKKNQQLEKRQAGRERAEEVLEKKTEDSPDNNYGV